jgi:hypothetical protein
MSVMERHGIPKRRPDGLIIEESQVPARWTRYTMIGIIPSLAGLIGCYLVLHRLWLGFAALLVVVYLSHMALYVRLRREMRREQDEARAQGIYLDWITPQWRRDAKLGKYYAMGIVGTMALLLMLLIAAAIDK